MSTTINIEKQATKLISRIFRGTGIVNLSALKILPIIGPDADNYDAIAKRVALDRFFADMMVAADAEPIDFAREIRPILPDT